MNRRKTSHDEKLQRNHFFHLSIRYFSEEALRTSLLFEFCADIYNPGRCLRCWLCHYGEQSGLFPSLRICTVLQRVPLYRWSVLLLIGLLQLCFFRKAHSLYQTTNRIIYFLQGVCKYLVVDRISSRIVQTC